MSQPVCRSARTLKEGSSSAPIALHGWRSRAATEWLPAEGRG
jgi:hypothetical protein